MTIDELIAVVNQATRDVAELEGVAVPAEVGPETRLFGEGGLFDSLGLVSLVLAVEESLQDQHGVTVSLADERAMSQKRSPFRTIRTLAEYTFGLLGDAVADTR